MSDENTPPNNLLPLFIVGLNALMLVLFLGPVAMHELRERRLLETLSPLDRLAARKRAASIRGHAANSHARRRAAARRR